MTTSSDPLVVAAVLAGGAGTRIGGTEPKQLLPLGGRPMLSYSLQTFDDTPEIDRIVVVGHSDHMDATSEIVTAAELVKPVSVVPGGETRSESSLAALQAISDLSDGLILIHDAARPLVNRALVQRVVSALSEDDAAAPALPAADTIVVIQGDSVGSMPRRDALRRLQTPQGFRLSVIRSAYAAAGDDPLFAATDDCGVVHRYLPHVSIRLVEGDDRNFKVTVAADLATAEALLAG